MKFATITALVAALAFQPLALAQEGGQARILKTRCLSFQAGQQIPQLYAHLVASPPETPGIPVNVKSYLNHEAEALTLAGDEIVFTTEAARASVSAPEKQVARMKVAPNLRRAILLFLPGGGEAAAPKFQVLAIDDSTKVFPRGSLKIINFSHFPLRIELEGKRFDFKSGETRVIEDPPVGNANSSSMLAYTFQSEQWQRIAAGSWPHPGKKRVLQIAFDNPKSNHVEMRDILDIAVRDTD